MKKYVLALSAVALASLTLAACGSGSTPGATKVTLTLYNGQHHKPPTPLLPVSKSATRTSRWPFRDGDEDTYDSQLLTRASARRRTFSLPKTRPHSSTCNNADCCRPLIPPRWRRHRRSTTRPRATGSGVSARVSVLIYNPSLIKRSALPKSVLQLANPWYKGQLAFAAGETDFQPIVTSVLKAYGRPATLKWLNGIKANSTGHVYPDNETIADEVNRGAVAFGVVNQYYWYRMQAEIGKSNMRSLIAHFAPHDPGYVIDVSGAGILKSSKHQAAAQKFVAFLVSKAGQEIIAHSISFEYPIASGVTTSQPETPFKDLQPYPIDLAQLGTGAAAIALLKEVQLL